MSAKLRYSRTVTIKLWRQHLGAQLPGTLPQPLNVRRHQEQCSRHKNIRTIPRYPCDPKKIIESWGEERQNIYVRSPHQSDEGGWGVKRILLSDIYNPKTQNSFLLDSTTANNQGGSYGRWRLWLPTCHAQYVTLSKRNSKVPPRIDPHIETLLQGGYHYINIT